MKVEKIGAYVVVYDDGGVPIHTLVAESIQSIKGVESGGQMISYTVSDGFDTADIVVGCLNADDVSLRKADDLFEYLLTFRPSSAVIDVTTGLAKTANLSDLTDFAVARQNLSVGRHFGSKTVAEMDGLSGMAVGDMVFNSDKDRAQTYTATYGWKIVKGFLFDFSGYTTKAITAGYDMAILSVDNITGSPTTTVLNDGDPYVLGDPISMGNLITITVSENSLIKLNIEEI